VGDQVPCTLRLGEVSSAGTAHLESEELIFRGTSRLVIRFSEVSSATVAPGDELRVTYPGGVVAISGLGHRAQRWATAITHPKPLLDKLGVKPGMWVAVVGVDDEDFVAQLTRRRAEVTAGAPRSGATGYDLIFLRIAERGELRRIPALAGRLRPEGALWVLRPKGSPDVGEVEMLDAGRAAGLVDTRVVAFSKVLSAARFVIPTAHRAERRAGAQRPDEA
jgi:hypothetical protein